MIDFEDQSWTLFYCDVLPTLLALSFILSAGAHGNGSQAGSCTCPARCRLPLLLFHARFVLSFFTGPPTVLLRGHLL